MNATKQITGHMTEQEVIDLMESSKNQDEWEHNCDIVIEAHGGIFPGYWHRLVIANGLASTVLRGGTDFTPMPK